MLRIVHVIQTLSPRFGGPVTVLKALAKQQAESGHDVTIVTTNTDYPTGVLTAPGEAKLDGGQAIIKFFHAQLPTFGLSIDFARELSSIVERKDIVHVWGLYRFPQYYACRVSRRLGVPYIVRPCGALEPALRRQSAISLPLKHLYEKFVEWPSILNASAINCVTPQESSNLPDFISRDKVFVLGNGIDWDSYDTLPSRGAFRRQLGLGGQPLALFLGRINFKKGLDILIPAFSNVKRAVPDAHLVLVGPENDNYGKRIRDLVDDHGLMNSTHFVGHLNGPEVIQAYVDADIFVLPSYTENFGMTILEAMACGLPVVISDQVNIHSDVEKAGAGCVTRCDVDEVAEAVADLLKDPETRNAMGRAGRRAARERFAWSAIVQAMTEEYEVIIDRAHHVARHGAYPKDRDAQNN